MDSLALGLALGLGAGLSPGPLLALVLTSSLRHGTRSGMAAAVAPLVSDLPIVLLSVTAVSALPQRLLAAAATAGGLFVIWLGVSAIRDARTAKPEQAPAAPTGTIWRAAAVNALSPHPWVFWLTVGGPVLVTSARAGTASAVAFLVGFYLLLIGAKVALAVVVGRTRHRIPTTWMRPLLTGAGGLLAVAGVALVLDFAGRLLSG